MIFSYDVQDIDGVCRVLSAILHLGDVDLAEVEPHHHDTVSYITNSDLTHIGMSCSTNLSLFARKLRKGIRVLGVYNDYNQLPPE